MVRRLVVLLLASVLGLSCDSGNPVSAVISGDYLPLTAGNEWKYAVMSYGPDTLFSVASVRLDSPFTSDGIAWYGVNDFCGKRTPSSPLPLYCAAYGKLAAQVLSLHLGPGPAMQDYEVALDFPMYRGKTWIIRSFDTTYTTESGDTVIIEEKNRRVAEGLAPAVVPADSFGACIQVTDYGYYRYEYRRENGSADRSVFGTSSTEWFAQNVGMVKQIVKYFTGDSLDLARTEVRTLTEYSIKGL